MFALLLDGRLLLSLVGLRLTLSLLTVALDCGALPEVSYGRSLRTTATASAVLAARVPSAPRTVLRALSAPYIRSPG